MAKYTIELDAFIPWNKLAGSFKGDKRGFFSEGGTSRLHLVGAFDTVTKAFVIDKNRTGCDPTFGRLLFVGPQGEKTAQLNKYIPNMSTVGNTSKVDIHMQAANPLIPFAPPIDFKGAFTFSQNPATGQLEIASQLYGSNFPAIEAKVTDERGKSIFLGGYSPEHKEDIVRLINNAENYIVVGVQDLGVVNTGRITINTDARGAFISINQGINLGVDKANPLDPGKDPVNLLSVHHEISIYQWNTDLLEATPIATDPDTFADALHHNTTDSQPGTPQHDTPDATSTPAPGGTEATHYGTDSSQPEVNAQASMLSDLTQLPDVSMLHYGADSSLPADTSNQAVPDLMTLHYGADSGTPADNSSQMLPDFSAPHYGVDSSQFDVEMNQTVPDLAVLHYSADSNSSMPADANQTTAPANDTVPHYGADSSQLTGPAPVQPHTDANGSLSTHSQADHQQTVHDDGSQSGQH